MNYPARNHSKPHSLSIRDNLRPCRYFILIVLLLACCNNSWSQITITGKISDSQTGEPLPGTNIVFKGIPAGTVSDIDGRYGIIVPSEETNLLFSYLGYEVKTEIVGDRMFFRLNLEFQI